MNALSNTQLISMCFLLWKTSLPAQLDWNFGITTGLTISAFSNNLNNASYDTFAGFTKKSNIQPVSRYMVGFFSELNSNNLSLKLGCHMLQTGGKYEEFFYPDLSTIDINPDEHLVSENYFLEYLSFPVTGEFRFKFFNTRPYISLGIAPNIFLNGIAQRTHSDTFFTFNFIGSLGDFLIQFDNHTYISKINKFDLAYSIGIGIYLTPKVAINASIHFGTNEVFCRKGGVINTTNHELVCAEPFKNQFIQISISHLLNNQFPKTKPPLN